MVVERYLIMFRITVASTRYNVIVFKNVNNFQIKFLRENFGFYPIQLAALRHGLYLLLFSITTIKLYRQNQSVKKMVRIGKRLIRIIVRRRSDPRVWVRRRSRNS